MQPLPHHYRTTIAMDPDAHHVTVRSPGVPDLETNAPVEYGGPGGRWSPETLLMGAVADCYALTFRAIASASKLMWHDLTCEVEGTLDKVDKVVRFTEIVIRARVKIPPESESRAGRILEKAKDTCLVTNSLLAEVHFQGETAVEG